MRHLFSYGKDIMTSSCHSNCNAMLLKNFHGFVIMKLRMEVICWFMKGLHVKLFSGNFCLEKNPASDKIGFQPEWWKKSMLLIWNYANITLVNLIKSDSHVAADVGLVIWDIQDRLINMNCISVDFLHRMANVVAHQLSKIALIVEEDSFWIESYPVCGEVCSR